MTLYHTIPIVGSITPSISNSPWLLDRADSLAETLSRGMKQKVANQPDTLAVTRLSPIHHRAGLHAGPDWVADLRCHRCNVISHLYGLGRSSVNQHGYEE